MTPIAVRRFTEGTWALLTEWAREITERVNSRLPTDGIEDLAVTPAKLAQVPAISLYRSGSQSIPNGGSSATLVAMTDVEFSTGGIDAPFVNGDMRIVVARDGLYRASAQLGFSPTAAPAGSVLEATICVDAVQVVDSVAAAVLNTSIVQSVNKLLRLRAGQIVDLRTYQTTGVAQNTVSPSHVRPQLCLEYVGEI